jgi:hypothetical protein
MRLDPSQHAVQPALLQGGDHSFQVIRVGGAGGAGRMGRSCPAGGTRASRFKTLALSIGRWTGRQIDHLSRRHGTEKPVHLAMAGLFRDEAQARRPGLG